MEPRDRALACEALLAMPKYVDNLHFIGMAGTAWLKLGNISAARQHFNRRLELEPDSVHALDGLGRCNLAQRNIPAAQQCFNRRLELEPDNTYALNGLGQCNIIEGNVPTARQNFTKILGLEPNNVYALNGLGLCELADGNIPAARQNFIRISELEINNLHALNGLGQCDLAENDIQALIRRSQTIETLTKGHRSPNIVRSRCISLLLICAAYLREPGERYKQTVQHIAAALQRTKYTDKAAEDITQQIVTAVLQEQHLTPAELAQQTAGLRQTGFWTAMSEQHNFPINGLAYNVSTNQPTIRQRERSTTQQP